MKRAVGREEGRKGERGERDEGMKVRALKEKKDDDDGGWKERRSPREVILKMSRRMI